MTMVEALSGHQPMMTIGDRALFSALLSALNTPTVWQRRLEGAFGDRQVLDRMLERLASGNQDGTGSASGLAKILDGRASRDVRDAVEEMLAIAGLAAVGGRSVGDIAERYMEKAELAAMAGWDADKLSVIAHYLSISGDLDAVLEKLTAFEADYGSPLGAALHQFSQRVEAIRQAVPSDRNIMFKADFGRRLDYYSGFNFELHFPGEDKPVAGGGRYDQLLSLLAPRAAADLSAAAVPAIGFVIWLDRLTTTQQNTPSQDAARN